MMQKWLFDVLKVALHDEKVPLLRQESATFAIDKNSANYDTPYCHQCSSHESLSRGRLFGGRVRQSGVAKRLFVLKCNG